MRRLATLALVSALLASTISTAQADEPGFEPNPYPHSVVIDWADIMLVAIGLNPPAPTATTWRLALVASAMYDAWSAYDATALSTQSGYDLKRPASERTDANKQEAVSYAAHRALSYVFPNQRALFDEVLAVQGFSPSNSVDTTTPAGIGNVAAQAVIDYRTTDGSNALGGFAQVPSPSYPELYTPVNSSDPTAANGINGPDFDPNRWQPLRVPNGTLVDDDNNPVIDHNDPSTYSIQSFLTPHWGEVEPFALRSTDQFFPAGPPIYGSDDPYVDALGNVSTNHQAWVDQTTAVLVASANLTDEAKVIAEFWADGPTTWTPPGHWIQIAEGISLRDGHSVDDDVKMYMALTGALLDSGITAWGAKRYYDFIRPVSAIRWYFGGETVEAWGGPDQGTQLIDGGDFQPYQSATFVTPPFSEFVSGHSTFSRASAEVLTAFAGTGAMYDGITKLGRDYDHDGVEDYFGQHIAVPGSLAFESGPAAPVVLQWATLTDSADEAGISRIYGGIHFQDGDLRAREAGRQIGQQAFDEAELYWNPFGKMTSTVTEFQRSGDVTTSVARQIRVKLAVGQRLLARGQETAGCNQLERVESQLAAAHGGTVSAEAFDLLNHQLAVVTDHLCS